MSKKAHKPADDEAAAEPAPTVEDLAALARKLKLPPRALDDVLEETTQHEAELAFEEQQAAGLEGQLLYLKEMGHTTRWLKQLIEVRARQAREARNAH
jgi:hypothetical protein